MKKLFLGPFTTVIYLTLISGILILPAPWAKQEFFWGGMQNAQAYTIANGGVVKFGSIAHYVKIFSALTGLPLRLGFYDLHIVFIESQRSPADTDSRITFYVKKNSIFWPYILAAWDPDGKSGDETMGAFSLKAGQSKTIGAVPIDVPLDYGSSFFALCNSYPCEDINKLASGALRIYASPNTFSLVMQWSLILAFWAVILSSFLDLVGKKWR